MKSVALSSWRWRVVVLDVVVAGSPVVVVGGKVVVEVVVVGGVQPSISPSSSASTGSKARTVADSLVELELGFLRIAVVDDTVLVGVDLRFLVVDSAEALDESR